MSEDILNAPIGAESAEAPVSRWVKESLTKAAERDMTVASEMGYQSEAGQARVRDIISRIKSRDRGCSTGPATGVAEAMAHAQMVDDVEYAKAKVELNREYGRVGGCYGMSADEIAQMGPANMGHSGMGPANSNNIHNGGYEVITGYDDTKAAQVGYGQGSVMNDPYQSFEAHKIVLAIAAEVYKQQPHKIKAFASELLSFFRE